MNELIQIILAQCVSVAFAVYISRTHVLRRVYIATFLNSCANGGMYLINGDPSTAIACAIVAVRGLVYIFKDRYHLPSPIIPGIFIVIHLTFGFLTIESPWQILTIVAPCSTCLYLWFGRNLQQLRVGNFLTHILWLIYDVHSGLFIVAVADAVIMIANAVAFVQNRTNLSVIYKGKEVSRHG